jgi:membrane associated rhomboid family serine protease
MNQNTAILCPNCKKLISGYTTECPHCGLKNPVRKQTVYRLLGSGKRSFTKTIIIINVIFFIASFLIPLFIPLNVPLFQRSFGILPSPSSQALGILGWAEIGIFLRGDWWVLITAMFLHGGILHILFNMLWVKDLAPQTETLFSPHKMVIIYVLAGIGGNLAALYTPVIAQSFLSISMENYPVVGASGAVFGLIGAIIAFGRKRGGFWGRQVVRQLGMWAAIMIAMGFIFPGISNAGHIGGFITGFLVGQLMPLRNTPSNNRIFVFIGTGLIVLCGYAFFQMIMRLVYIMGHL